MKKIFIIPFVFLLGLFLFSCKKKTNTFVSPFDKLTTTNDLYGFSCASAGMIASNVSTPSATTKSNVSQLLVADTTTDTLDEQTVNELNDYMYLVESMLSTGGFTQETVNTPNTDPYYNKYTYMMTVSYANLLGSKIEYKMYYNETPKTKNNDDKEKFNIEGIMVLDDNQEYQVTGKRETETDTDGKESELQFTVTMNENETIEVKQSSEQEGTEQEEEFQYKYKNKTLNKEETSKFSFENEDNKLEVKLQLEQKEANVKTSKIFYLEVENKDNKEQITIKVGDKNNKKKYYVEITDNGYIYKLDGQDYKKDRK